MGFGQERTGEIVFGQPFIQNGSLWLYGNQTDETERAELMSVDLEAGTAQMCWPKDIAELVPYGEDKLLALQRDEQQRRDRLLVLSAKTRQCVCRIGCCSHPLA